MLRLLLFPVFLFGCIPLFSQTQIAVSNHPEATANGNQRKIVRNMNDQVFVVFGDVVNDTSRIMGISNTAEFTQWTEPAEICTGKNPTLVLCHEDWDEWFGLIYENPGSPQQIVYRYSEDFEEWSEPVLLSDPLSDSRLPVADVDSSGCVNVLWIEKEVQEHLVYAQLNADTLTERFTVVSSDSICNIAIANHLQYFKDDLFFGLHTYPDTLLFYLSTDHLETMELLYDTLGISPCITYNSAIEGHPVGNAVRFMFQDQGPWGSLYEVQAHEYDYSNIAVNSLFFPGVYRELCVNNLLPDLGYSFIYIDESGNLIHAFSFGPYYEWCQIMETIEPGDGPILHPSLAYKNFNMHYVDFIWMEDNGSNFSIYHKRDQKQVGMGIDTTGMRGFYFTGGPNPFSGRLEMTVYHQQDPSEPELAVFDPHGRFIRNLPVFFTGKKYRTSWDATTADGTSIQPGIYLIRCTVGKFRTVKKVVYQP
jgi:hypothetical protein